MTSPPETLSGLLEDLYEAAAAPKHWQQFFTRLSEICKADKTYFLIVDPQKHCDLSLQYGFEDKAVTDYVGYFSGRDLVLDGFVEAHRRHGAWIGSSETVLPKSTLRSSEIFNDFMRPNRSAYQCGAALQGFHSDVTVGLAMMREEVHGDFTEETIALLATLAPHLTRAIHIHQTLQRERAQNVFLQQLIDAVSLALVAVDGNGRILDATATARKILETRDGLCLTNGYLQASLHSEQLQLSSLLSGAAATGAGCGLENARRTPGFPAPQVRASARWSPCAGGAMLLSRRPPKRPLQVVVTPFRSSEIFLAEKPSALVFLGDPDAVPPSRSGVLRALYGLSPSECRVADLLAAGHEIAFIADDLRVARETARYHLKSIFRKTATHRQSELMRLLAGLPGHAVS